MDITTVFIYTTYVGKCLLFQVLYPALRWLEHDPACRRRHCFEVLSHIRLPLISPQVLDEALKNVQDPSIAVALKTVRVDMVSIHPDSNITLAFLKVHVSIQTTVSFPNALKCLIDAAHK